MIKNYMDMACSADIFGKYFWKTSFLGDFKLFKIVYFEIKDIDKIDSEMIYQTPHQTLTQDPDENPYSNQIKQLHYSFSCEFKFFSYLYSLRYI